MKLNIKAQSDEQSVTIPEQSPFILPKPHWLEGGEYDGPIWIVIDDNPSSPKPHQKIRFDFLISDPRRPGEICRLNDLEYSHLLDTAKRQIYHIRTGKYATVTTAKPHEEMARAVLNWVAWMILNGIRRFSYLTQDDFDSYTELATYGPGHLLMYGPRLAEYVKGLKKAGIKIPSVKLSNKKPYLDTRKLLEDAGIDPKRGYVDKATSYELLKAAEAEGFYLTPKQIARLAAGPPKPEVLVSIPLLRLLQPWDYQWRMRDELYGDHIRFDPFHNASPEKISQELGNKIGRTETAPIRQTMELIDRSIRWVLDYAPVLLDLREKYETIIAEGLDRSHRLDRMAEVIYKSRIPEGPGRPFPLNACTKRSPSVGLDFGTAVFDFIPAACAVVISAFSGRRHDEVLSIRAAGPSNDDSISQDEQGLWLETYIEKTVGDWQKTPCNEVVVAAVAILRRWSAPALSISDDVSLFQYKRLISGEVVYFSLKSALKEFVDFLSLTPTSKGSRWVFKPHQFRRFFAIMYFWRYQYRDLAALSHQLRHFNPAMTQRYVTESESGAIFRYVNKDYTTTILTEAALGERNISGPFGERFKTTVRKLRAHYRRLVKVVTPTLVGKLVERYVERSGRRLKAFQWGYCTCTTLPQELRLARCLQNYGEETAIAPDLSRSSPVICGDCPHHVTESVFEKFWRTEMKLHEEAASDPSNGPLIREVSGKHAETLRHQYERSFKNSEPLESLDGNSH